MSNEYKDWKSDLRQIFEEKVRDLDFLYDGWANSFVPQPYINRLAIQL